LHGGNRNREEADMKKKYSVVSVVPERDHSPVLAQFVNADAFDVVVVGSEHRDGAVDGVAAAPAGD